MDRSSPRMFEDPDSVNIMLPTEENVGHIHKRLAAEGRSNTLSNELSVFQSRRSAIRYINNLPEDILLHIFMCLTRMILDDYRDTNIYRVCLDITHVCQHWRKIALECPIFWSNIIYSVWEKTSKKLIRLFLERSAMANIEVSFVLPRRSAESTDILELLRGHMLRVSSLSLSTYWSWELVQELLMESGPRLKYLHLNALHKRPETLAQFLNHPPSSIQLSTLSITDISLFLNSPILRGLSVLNISNDDKPIRVQYTLSELLDVLESCPLLRILCIVNSQIIATSGNVGKCSIELLSLESLALDYIDYDAYLSLMDCIVIRNDIKWNIKCYNFPIERPWQLTPYFPQRTEQCKSFTIKFSQTSFEFRVACLAVPYINFKRLLFHWDHFVTPQTLSNSLISMTKTLVAKSDRNSADEVELLSDLGYDIAHETFWTNILTLLPRIPKMCISIRVRVAQHQDNNGIRRDVLKGLIGALTEPTNHDAQTPTWLCPALEKLEFKSMNFHIYDGLQYYAKLIDHLQHRRNHGHGLHTLHFKHCPGINVKEVDELKRLNVAREIELGWDSEDSD